MTNLEKRYLKCHIKESYTCIDSLMFWFFRILFLKLLTGSCLPGCKLFKQARRNKICKKLRASNLKQIFIIAFYMYSDWTVVPISIVNFWNFLTTNFQTGWTEWTIKSSNDWTVAEVDRQTERPKARRREMRGRTYGHWFSRRWTSRNDGQWIGKSMAG